MRLTRKLFVSGLGLLSEHVAVLRSENCDSQTGQLLNRPAYAWVHGFPILSAAVNHSSMDALWAPESKSRKPRLRPRKGTLNDSF